MLCFLDISITRGCAACHDLISQEGMTSSDLYYLLLLPVVRLQINLVKNQLNRPMAIQQIYHTYNMWIYSRPAQGHKRVYLACSLQFKKIMCPKQTLGLIQYKQTNLGGFAESTLNEQGIFICIMITSFNC